MKLRFYVPLTGALIIGAMMISGCGSSKKVVAVFNGNDISLEDFAKQMETKTAVVGRNGNQPLFALVGNRALEELLINQANLSLAKKLNLLPTDKEVNDELERLKRNNPNMQTQLAASGRTIDDVRQELRVTLAVIKIKGKDVHVTDKDITDTYEQLKTVAVPNGFMTPETVQIMLIAIGDDAKKKKAEDEIKRGVDFQTVSKKYNDYPTIVEAGSVYVNPANGSADWDLPSLEKAITSKATKVVTQTAPGTTTPWMKVPTQNNAGGTKPEWLIMKVLKKTPQSVKPLTPDLKVDIQHALINSKANQQNYAKQINDVIKEMKIDIKREPYRTTFKATLEKLKKGEAPGMTGTSPGGSTVNQNGASNPSSSSAPKKPSAGANKTKP